MAARTYTVTRLDDGTYIVGMDGLMSAEDQEEIGRIARALRALEDEVGRVETR